MEVFCDIEGAGVAAVGGENLVVKGENAAVCLLLFSDHNGALDEATVASGRFVANTAKGEAFLEKLCGV